ncbi:MAG: glycosyltransferase family 4 protein [Flavobacteriales bacterium]|nr:glycosyltransferase family 4 protein [Flavobacteriales bacterium]
MTTFAAVHNAPRIAFLTTTDPHDRRSWSGIHAVMLDELQRRFEDVLTVGPFDGGAALLGGRLLNRALLAATGKRFDYAHGDRLVRHYAPMVKERLRRAHADLVIAPAATALLAGPDLGMPFIFLSDTTLANMLDYYEPYSALSSWSKRQSLRNESAAIQRSAFAVFPSDWAASSAVRDHGARPEQVAVVPFGANFKTVPSVAIAHGERPSGELRLLFLGVDWERKGGPLVLETVLQLRSAGVPVRLTIAGVVPPIEASEHIDVIPFIDKNTPDGERRIQALMLSHHFLFVPSRAECYGIVFCEAAACGLPSIARRTGGIAGALVDGVNGRLLPSDAPAADYAEVIRSLWADQSAYSDLQRSARRLFETTHNWKHWGDRMEELIASALR